MKNLSGETKDKVWNKVRGIIKGRVNRHPYEQVWDHVRVQGAIRQVRDQVLRQVIFQVGKDVYEEFNR
jgi:hypothetical protein